MNFALIIVCISSGLIVRRLKIIPADSYKSINVWVLYIALPALSLRFIPDIKWSLQMLLPILAPFVVWGGAWLFVKIYDTKKHLDSASRTALFVVCGLGNTAFIGFPMTSAFYGESGLNYAVIFDQTTFVIFATMGVITILRNSNNGVANANFFYVFKKILRFPPLIGCIAALVLPHFTDISMFNPFFDKLVVTISPMALFSIGLQLKLGEMRKELKLLSAGIFYKLILSPLLVVLLALAMQLSGNIAKISVFEAGMSSHITASMLVSQHNLNPRYCSLIVGLGIVVGFFTSTIWYLVLEVIF